MKVGDKVCYARKFLKSTGSFTGPIPFARGVVKKIVDYGQGWNIATVDWGLDDEIPKRVNVKNLSVVDPEKGIVDEY